MLICPQSFENPNATSSGQNCGASLTSVCLECKTNAFKMKKGAALWRVETGMKIF